MLRSLLGMMAMNYMVMVRWPVVMVVMRSMIIDRPLRRRTIRPVYMRETSVRGAGRLAVLLLLLRHLLYVLVPEPLPVEVIFALPTHRPLPLQLPVPLLLLLLFSLIAFALPVSHDPVPLLFLMDHTRIPFFAAASTGIPPVHPTADPIPVCLRAGMPIGHCMHRRYRPPPVHAHARLHVTRMMSGHMRRRRHRSMSASAAPRAHTALTKIWVVRVDLMANTIIARSRRHRAHFMVAGVALMGTATHEHGRSMRRWGESRPRWEVRVDVHVLPRAPWLGRASRHRPSWTLRIVLIARTSRCPRGAERVRDVSVGLIAHTELLQVRMWDGTGGRGSHGSLLGLHGRQGAVGYAHAHAHRPAYAHAVHARRIALELGGIVRLLLVLVIGRVAAELGQEL